MNQKTNQKITATNRYLNYMAQLDHERAHGNRVSVILAVCSLSLLLGFLLGIAWGMGA